MRGCKFIARIFLTNTVNIWQNDYCKCFFVYSEEIELKKLDIGVLNDYYGGLLNKHQSEIMRLYHDCDMSLAEIAEQIDITRQGVREVIVRSTKKLQDYEKKLGIVKKVKGLAKKLEETIDEMEVGSKTSQRMQELLKNIKEI